MITVKIKPTRTLFYNEDNSFGIYGCDVNPECEHLVKVNQYNNISIKGVTPKLNHGEEYEVVLKEDAGSTYAGSYIIESIKKKRPQTIEEQRVFLESILTPSQVNSIYEVYSENDDVVGLIENGEFDFKKVKGIAEKTFEKLQKKVMENVDISEVLTFLSKYGIKYNMISKLIKTYGNPQIVIQKIQDNPYVLTEVNGIGFKTADEIAKAIGYDLKSEHRIESALRYIIQEENQSGHSWIDYKTLLNRAIELLSISKTYIIEVLNDIQKSHSKKNNIVNFGNRYTTKSVYEAEKHVALNMIRLKSQSKKMFDSNYIDKFLDEYCDKHGVELEENQRQFFHDWNENSVLMLIGGGGMGKSWLQIILLQLISNLRLTVALLAPTGKASKVMTNYTGRQASTIHRKAGVFENDDEAGVKAIMEDVIIIDESSMCDVFILSKFFKALQNTNARVLFVGDDFQLPSVGVGNFLYDVINSGTIKISRLKKVFRQADGGILNVATDIREGKKFLKDGEEGRKVFGKDCVFWLTSSDFIKDGVLTNYKKVIESGKWSQDDIVILSPTNKGKLGTVELNKEIQKIANPASPNKKEKQVGRKDNPTIFRVGDSIMNTVNTYDIETLDGGTADVFNGDTGKIIDIDEEGKFFIIDFEGVVVKFKFGTILTNVIHSWVTTIHKSQGSQYKIVIIIADKSMSYQLNANLMYTGGSRAKDYELWFTQVSTVNRAMAKFANMERRSFLIELLKAFDSITEVTDRMTQEELDKVNDYINELK